MTTQRCRGAMLACWLASATGLAMAQGTHSAVAGGHTAGSGSQQMHQVMAKSMHDMESMKTSGNTDKDFATMMRMHHLSGIEMAKIQLAHGKDPEMRRIAQNIVDSQQKEVDEFDKWLARRR